MAGPEANVKRNVSKILRAHENVYYNMPVPGGFGASMLDYVGCVRGHFFAIETKAAGRKPTALQEACIKEMRAAGATVFVIDGEAGYKALRDWLGWRTRTADQVQEDAARG